MIFIQHSNEQASNFDHFKAKPLDRNEDGSLIQN